MTHTQSRTIQWLGIILVAVTIALGYWYFSVRAGVRTGTSLALPAGAGRLDSGLAAYYALDAASGSSATDSSTNANTGTLTNMETPTDWVAAQVGNGLDFDGVDEYVTVADTALQDYGDTESFTIAGWFNRDTFTTDDTIIAKRNGITAADAGYLCYIDDATDQLICEISDGTDEYSVTSSSTFTATGWNHFAFVWDQASATATNLYINGVSNNPTKSGTIGNIGDLSNAVAFRLGAESDAGNPYDGKLDEMRVYNRPLLPDEISELYRLTATTGIDTGLKGYWSFDGGSMATTTTMRDLSGARNTGTLTGGPTVTTGRIGQALNFDGTNDYVNVGSATNIDNLTDISMCAWINADPSAGWTSDFWNVLSQADNGGAEATLSVSDETNGVMRLQWYRTFSGTPGIWETGFDGALDTGPAIVADTWTHVCVTYNNSATTNDPVLYINGAAVKMYETSTPVGTASSTAGGDYFIGALDDGGTGGSFAKGQIDEVRLYNRLLAAGEVQALYQLSERDEVSSSASQPQGGGRMDSGLIAYWPLDETTGSTATDSSNGGNNQTLTNMENGDWVTGQIGNSLSFDGAGEYATSSRTIPSRGTLSVWLKSGASLDTGNNYLALFAGDASNYLSIYATTFTTTNTYCFGMRGNFGADVSICGPEFANTAAFQEWHHVTATWDATEGATLYIDGGAAATTPTGTSSFLSMNLGLSVNDTSQDWLGQLDEVRMYNRMLTADEVSQLSRLTSPTPVDTTLEGYWAMSGQDVSGTSVYDMSGTGNTGTLTNSPTPAAGIVGQGYSFDGTNDYIDMGNSATLKPANFTLSMWTFADTGDASTYRLIFKPSYSDSGFDSGWSLHQRDESTTSGPYGVRWGDGTNPTAGDLIGSTNIVGGWHHVVVSFDGTTMRLYVDGALEASGNASTLAYDATSYNAQIGGGGWGLNYFDGRIDETRLYSRVLTAAEIVSLYAQGQPDKSNTAASQAQGTGRLDSGLAGYWRLDENTGTSAADASTNAITALTLTNGPTWTTGQVGSAIDFDGTDDYATTADNDVIDIADSRNFTLSGWFNRDTFTTDDTIIAKRNGIAAGDVGYLCYIDDATDQLICEVSDGTDEYSIASTSTFTATGWNHFAFVWDDSGSGKTRLYVNAAVDTYATTSGTFTNVNSLANAVAFRLGAESDNGNPFDGKIDEARIYARALSADEVGLLYRSTTPTGTETGLKGYWSFNGPDIVGTLAYDRSGAGNNGTLTNTPTRTIGKLGQALNFASASTQYVNIGTGIPDSANTSACAWVKPSTALTTIGDILARATVTPTGWTLGLDFTTLSSLRLAWYRSFNGTDGYWLTQQAIPYSEWTHVCATYNNSATTNDPVLYVNGAVATVIENQTPTGATDTGGNVAIGAFYDGSSGAQELFNGAIDEVRVYNRILTASEVKALYDASR